MALTVGTDSYCTLAEAETYMGTLTFKSAWTGTDAAKEAVLKQAARLLDTLRWKGVRTSSTQAMQWPREGVLDRDGYYVENDAYPTQIKNAQAELALRLISEDRTADSGAIVPESLTVGSLRIDKLRRTVIPPSVLELCREFLAAGSGTVLAERG